MKTAAKLTLALQQAILEGRIEPDMTFSQKVWAYCVRIPRGKVITYGQLARQLGKPRAARAVGQALRNNPLAPRVPCHRVVGHDGALTGYAGGSDGLPGKRKRLLAEGVEFVSKDRVRLDL